MRIKKLSLLSANIRAQKHFYTEVLGCELLAESEKHFDLEIGATKLRIEENAEASPYHFAINIPSNQIHSALEWLKERVEVLPVAGEEIVDFSAWRALSLYFYDQDKNIVEFISRERIDQHVSEPFSSEQLLSISEIGMPVTDIKQAYRDLAHAVGPSLPLFSGSFDVFCALGDDNGLFIVIDPDKKDWFPNDDPAPASDFNISGIENGVSFSFQFRNGKVLTSM